MPKASKPAKPALAPAPAPAAAVEKLALLFSLELDNAEIGFLTEALDKIVVRRLKLADEAAQDSLDEDAPLPKSAKAALAKPLVQVQVKSTSAPKKKGA